MKHQREIDLIDKYNEYTYRDYDSDPYISVDWQVRGAKSNYPTPRFDSPPSGFLTEDLPIDYTLFECQDYQI